MTAEQTILSLRSASFGYAGRAVVSGISLDIAPGEIAAILGPNGSGKSTLMRGVLGLNDHIDGSASLFGVPAERFKNRTRIGYVPQRHTLSGSVRATVEEIVEVGRLPHRPWYRRAGQTDRDAVRTALEAVGLADRAKHDVSAFSGGQHRRVLIARALAAQPDILIMDEPTAGMDQASQEVLVDVLHHLAGTGVAMLIVTHGFEALSSLVTRIIEVAHGHIAFDGTPQAYAQRLTDLVGGSSPMTTGHDHGHRDVPLDKPRLAPGLLEVKRHDSQGDFRG